MIYYASNRNDQRNRTSLAFHGHHEYLQRHDRIYFYTIYYNDDSLSFHCRKTAALIVRRLWRSNTRPGKASTWDEDKCKFPCAELFNQSMINNDLPSSSPAPLSTQYILRVAPDLEWHAACLKCQECRQFLDESCTCFVRDGKTYCKRDYVR